MNPADHLSKAQRVERSMRKLAAGTDYLAIVDGALIAGYHWGNALLHRHGVLPDDEHANTPSKLTAGIEALPQGARPAFRAFAELEQLRSDYVRSPSRYAVGLEERVWRALDAMKRAATA
jgi:hypothetical protein